jgi:hypothetical protein
MKLKNCEQVIDGRFAGAGPYVERYPKADRLAM